MHTFVLSVDLSDREYQVVARHAARMATFAERHAHMADMGWSLESSLRTLLAMGISYTQREQQGRDEIERMNREIESALSEPVTPFDPIQAPDWLK